MITKSPVGRYAIYVVLSVLAFAQPLWRLIRYAAHSELHSHILLVPFVVAYLLYNRRERPNPVYQSSKVEAFLLATLGLTSLGIGSVWSNVLTPNDYLALMTLAFVTVIAAGGFLFFGARWMWTAAFPMSFLAFMIPMPDSMADVLEVASMRASADVAAWMVRMSGVPLWREGQVFVLPGIALQVAQECSGIRSSWVLFITSLVASDLFLTSAWRRAVLVAFVIPLGVIRNGFRILVIAMLCVYVSPNMIDSVVHHQGGPLFFALSLVPLTFSLWLLQRGEVRRR